MRYRRWKFKLRQAWEWLTEPWYLNPAALWESGGVRQVTFAACLLVLIWGIGRLSFLPFVGGLNSALRTALTEPMDFGAAAERVRSLDVWRAASLTGVIDRLGSPLALRSLQKNRGAPPDSTLVRGADLAFPYWPVQNAGIRVSTRFEWSESQGGQPARLHEGIDLEAPEGAEIVSVTDGTVARVAEDAELGKFVEVDHGRGLTTIYGHASAIMVKPGQKVKAGEIVARVGRTGRAETSKLHFEVRVAGKAVDPEPFLGVKKTGD